MKMTESFFSSNWLRGFFKESDLCQKRHFWKCKSSFIAHNVPKTRKWKIALFIFKTVIFLELVKPHGWSSPHFGLSLMFENRLRRPNGRLRRKNIGYYLSDFVAFFWWQKNCENTFLERLTLDTKLKYCRDSLCSYLQDKTIWSTSDRKSKSSEWNLEQHAPWRLQWISK